MISSANCEQVAEFACDFVDRRLSPEERAVVEAHLRACASCRAELSRIGAVRNLMKGSLESGALAADFKQKTGERMRLTTAAVLAVQSEEPEAEPVSVMSLTERLGAAPWWAVSVALHVLVIILLGLITMTIGILEDRTSVVVLTNLEKMAASKLEEPKKEKADLRDVLKAKETPPTDQSSDTPSNIVVPPEILAKAELGDHFETINLDRPDTQSAFGNPDARMFHSASGNDEAEGGGGLGGSSLMDDLIGAGGSSSPGTGGGWGGGNGTGTGIGNGAGHGSFGQRSGGGRKLMVMKHGGSKATESAVDAALAWLARHQEADGHWNINKYGGGGNVDGGLAYDESCTALSVLAFLGAGHTSRVGKYADNVKRGVYWLLSKQQKNGAFTEGPRTSGYDQYDTMIAILALAEHFGMTKDPESGKAAQKGVDYLMTMQGDFGGWSHGGIPSTSVLGWAVMALKSAKMAKLNVPAKAFEGALKRLEAVSEKGADGYWGMVGYANKGQYAYSKGMTMTAVGMVCLQFMGMGAETSHQAELLEKYLPQWKVGESTVGEPQNFYHWYYATLGMFQAGGGHWKNWNEALKKTLVPTQCKGGVKDGTIQDVDGSWDPVDCWAPTAGRVYTTALGALCLEVYYRYLPMMK